ncbi:MAG TPA: cache domain-containing protein [Blastocatellia bacterium]|nr:cache domain-containing protein [Blastocatellia bacterium]
MRLSEKLGAVCAGAAILPLLVAALVVLSQLSAHARRQAEENLQREAQAAAAIADKRLVALRSAAQRLADDIANRALAASDQNVGSRPPTPQARIQDIVSRALQDDGLDFVIVADTQGRVIARHNDLPAPSEMLTTGDDRNLLAAAPVLSHGQPIAAAVSEGTARLKTLGLDQRAQVKLGNGAVIDQALMTEAAAPIQGGGRSVGVVLIGQMVNNDTKPRPGATTLQTPLVAEIRQTLYPQTDEATGAVVIYQNAIIASSVVGSGNETGPALMGTLCDVAQSPARIDQSNESYVVAWQAMKSVDGAEVGRVGVARDVRALRGATPAARTALLLITLVAAALAGAGGFFYGRTLGARLDGLNEAVTRWGVGELSAPAKDREPVVEGLAKFTARDEINRLAASLEQTRESFRQAIDRLRRR